MAIKICLDAGHYLNYNRGTYNDYYEGNGNFALQEVLAPLLEQKGFEVVKTKHTVEANPDLDDRGSMAKGCQMFLSLHSDAGGSKSFVTAIRSLKRPNSQEFGAELVTAVQELISSDIPEVTKSIYEGAVDGVWTKPYSDNSPTTDFYGVIRAAATHTECEDIFLLECGHHSHYSTCAWLDNGSNRQRLAEAIADTISKHYGLEDSNTSTPSTPSEYDTLLAQYRQLESVATNVAQENERLKLMISSAIDILKS